MNTNIKVTYSLPTSTKTQTEIDEKIIKYLESIGAKWYAQGVDLRTRTRDISFDLNIKLKDEVNENRNKT